MSNPMLSAEGYLRPLTDEESLPFWEGTRVGELRIQTCAAPLAPEAGASAGGGTSCGRLRFPPRPMCPWCRSTSYTWQVMSGRGTIWSFVIPHPPLLPAYAELAPYNCVVVALDEDPLIRLVGNLVASPDAPINSVEPSTIEIGHPVSVVFQRLDEEFTLPRWIQA